MELRHLRYFLTVAEEGHFGRAAQRLHIVQPALSMQIRALEKELGGPLFMRTSRRVELTEAGTLLLEEAKRTLEQAAHAKSTVQRAIRGELGIVRIGFAGNAVFSGKLTADLRGFHSAYPDAELILREIAPQLQVEGILAGQLDVGYAPDRVLGLDQALVAEQVGTWRFVVAMPCDHPLARKKRLNSTFITTEPLILYAQHDDDESQITTLRRVFGCEPKVAYRVANTLSVLALAASGLGLAFVPATFEQITIPGLVYRPFDEPELTTNLFMISRAAETGGAVRAYLERARQDNAKK